MISFVTTTNVRMLIAKQLAREQNVIKKQTNKWMTTKQETTTISTEQDTIDLTSDEPLTIH